MEVIQDGNKNIQSVGDGNTIVQHNYIASLSKKPTEIKVTAHRSFSLWLVFFSSVIPLCLMLIGNSLNMFNISFNEMSRYLMNSFIVICIIAIFVYRYIYTRTHLWYVTYNDGVFIFNDTLIKFYKNIWDIKIMKMYLPFGGAILTLYYIDPKNNRIQEKKIFLDEFAEAKYIHDSFHAGNNEI